jgi:hypothetical protein
MRKWLKYLGLGAGAAAFGIVAAIAQNPGVGGINIASPIGTEQVNAENTGPQITWVYLTQIRDSVGYAISAATSGTVTFGANSLIVLTDATTISTLTIAFTPAPVDGQQNCWFNQSAISTLTMSATSPQTIKNGLTSTSATTRYCWVYQASTGNWNRSL